MPHEITSEEGKILDLMAEAWNLFLELPREHIEEVADFRRHLHDLQRVVLSRPTGRQVISKLGQP